MIKKTRFDRNLIQIGGSQPHTTCMPYKLYEIRNLFSLTKGFLIQQKYNIKFFL